MRTTTKKLFLMPSLALIFSFFAETVMAHCPLCTIGAAAAAGGASMLGVNNGVIGLFIGAFAVSVGYMVAKYIKKQYIPFQKEGLVLFSFATTVIPLLPLIKSVYPVSIFITGGYGSLLNRTYIINLFLIGSILGGIIMAITPWLSARISRLRDGKMVPYQGMLLTLVLLVVAGFIIQFTT